MNKYDIENIEKIIESRKPIDFSDEGDELVEFLKTLPTEELLKKIKNYQYKVKDEFKKIVKYLFDTYADTEEDDNIIILSECWLDESDSRYMYNIGNEIYSFYSEFQKFETGRNNKWAQSIKFEEDNDDITNSYNRLWELMNELKIPFAEEIYETDSSVNCYWHGFVCVTKDYKILNFVCRDDGMMLNELKQNPPEPVMQF